MTADGRLAATVAHQPPGLLRCSKQHNTPSAADAREPFRWKRGIHRKSQSFGVLPVTCPALRSLPELPAWWRWDADLLLRNEALVLSRPGGTVRNKNLWSVERSLKHNFFSFFFRGGINVAETKKE